MMSHSEFVLLLEFKLIGLSRGHAARNCLSDGDILSIDEG